MNLKPIIQTTVFIGMIFVIPIFVMIIGLSGTPSYIHQQPYDGMNIFVETGTIELIDLLIPSICLVGILIAIIICMHTKEELV